MSSSFRQRIAEAVVALAVLVAAPLVPAGAAEPVFPPGLRLGLVPPAGMTVSKTFPGFEDAGQRVAIVLADLPREAFSELGKTFAPEVLKTQGLTEATRDDVTLKEGGGFIIRARQEANGVVLRKWALVAQIGNLTALISLQMPDAAAATYPDEVLKAALTSLVMRTRVPDEEQLGLLPYKVTSLAGFRIVRTAPTGAALFTDGPDDAVELARQPLFLIAPGPGAPEQPHERDTLARQLIGATPGIKDMKVTRSEPLRIGRQQGHEIMVEAKDGKTDTDLVVVQWLRFGQAGHVRLVGIARKDAWPKLFPRFRELRDALELR